MAEVGSKATPGSGGFYVVAVKAPNGYRLRAFRMEKIRYGRPGGGYDEVDEARLDDTIPEHVVYGYAAEKGKMPMVPVRFGYAMNENVPARSWETWLAQNRDHPAVTSGIIFGFRSMADAEASAKECKSLRDGLEPMQIDVFDDVGNVKSRDPRVPSGMSVGRADVARTF